MLEYVILRLREETAWSSCNIIRTVFRYSLFFYSICLRIHFTVVFLVSVMLMLMLFCFLVFSYSIISIQYQDV